MTATFDPNVLGYERRLAMLAPARQIQPSAKRGVRVPGQCWALVWENEAQRAAARGYGPAAKPRLLRPGDVVDGAAVHEAMFFTCETLPLTFEIGPLVSADDYDCHAEMRLGVSLIREMAELVAFRETFLSRPGSVTTGEVAERFVTVVSGVLTEYARERTASDLVRTGDASALESAIAAALGPKMYACGLSLGGAVRVSFSSPAWEAARRAEEAAARRKQQADAQVQVRQALAEARVRHLAQLEELLHQAEQLAARRPDLKLTDLIKSYDSAQRGELYLGLLGLGPTTARPQSILVAAGDELLWFDPADPETVSRRVSLASLVGPLRSVRVMREEDKTVLLVGAGRGVHRVLAGSERKETYSFDPGMTARSRGHATQPLRTGVNAAVVCGGHVVATHSEAGLIVWRIGEHDVPAFPLQEYVAGVETVRDAQVDEAGRVWFAAGERIIAWSPGDEGMAAQPLVIQAPNVVECLLVTGEWVLAGLADGRVVRWMQGDPGAFDEMRAATRERVRALSRGAGGPTPRLLVAAGRPTLDLLVIDDDYRIEYRAPEPLRWGWAADDWIVAVNDRRDRFYLWAIGRPDAPASSVPVARLCGHSIQDVALVGGSAALLACG
jgi:hypothetical protein